MSTLLIQLEKEFFLFLALFFSSPLYEVKFYFVQPGTADMILINIDRIFLSSGFFQLRHAYLQDPFGKSCLCFVRVDIGGKLKRAAEKSIVSVT